MPTDSNPDWRNLRLTDRIEPGVHVLFVGINPGVRSAQTGHHFAGYSNRFWKLLYESGLVPERITWIDDLRLPQWGLGITNVIGRPSPGIDDLRPAEYLEGWRALDKKVDAFRPDIVAFVGVTLYRVLCRVLGGAPEQRIKLGLQSPTVHGARIFVLPNPSGRNANFSYAEMLAAFRALHRALRRSAAGHRGPSLDKARDALGPPKGASDGDGGSGRLRAVGASASLAGALAEAGGAKPPGLVSAPRPGHPRREAASSTESAAGGAERFHPAAGRASRTRPSTRAAAPSRKVLRKRDRSR
jgi:TDG/mug DNA glycosylase family protein